MPADPTAKYSSMNEPKQNQQKIYLASPQIPKKQHIIPILSINLNKWATVCLFFYLFIHPFIYSSHISTMSTVYKMLGTQKIQRDMLPLIISVFVALFQGNQNSTHSQVFTLYTILIKIPNSDPAFFLKLPLMQQGLLHGSVIKNLPAMQEMQEMWVPSLDQEDPLDEGMVTHCSILPGKIPWTEELGGLQSMGCSVTTEVIEWQQQLMQQSLHLY